MSDKLNALLSDKRNTRIALATALVEANAEREALRAALSLARVELAAAKNAATPVAWPTAPKAARQLPAHFVAAREAAMRLGRVVRVGA
jgi:hypothetical protein